MNLFTRRSVSDRLLLGNITLIAGSLLLFAICARFVIASVILNALDASLQGQARNFEAGPGRALRHNQLPPLDPAGPAGEDQGPPDPNRPRPNGQEAGLPGANASGGNRPLPRDQRDQMQPLHDIGLPVLRRPVYISVAEDNSPLPITGPLFSEEGFQNVVRTGNGFWENEPDPHNDETERVYSLPVKGGDGRTVGVIQTAAPRTDTDRAVNAVTRGLTFLLPVIALIAGGGGVLLTRYGLAPVGKLADAAAHIEASRLSERLPETGGNDEFDRLTQMLNLSLARLEESFARQKRFAADASHELRTPLAVIKTATSMLLEEGLPPELQREAIRDADNAADRATRLIADLLFFARSEGRTLPVRPASVSVAELLTRAAREAETAFRRTGSIPATITVEASPKLTLNTDAALLQRILLNLLSNALRYTPADKQITLRAQNTERNILFIVRDTGSGIPAEHLSRLGEPFYRPDQARGREDGGTGLGLSICRGIAETLGGTVLIESGVGVGTTVTVSLPSLTLPQTPQPEAALR